ncbi:MAG: hypothetical protein EXS09_13775 [Gemmataceae bacterium]|nr:hypothetical protein [Gemmataceae bacterium]
MKRAFLGIAALALVLVATETASAGPRIGVSVGGGSGYYGGYNSGFGVNYGTRVGNNGYLNLNYSSGYSYPAYGYARPAYYTGPVYGSPYYYNAVPQYYAQPYGYSFSYRTWGW